MDFSKEQIEAGNKLLEELAVILDTADDVHREHHEPTYDQAQIVHKCGTPACALGHWAVAHPERWLVNSHGAGGWARLIGEKASPIYSARKEFSLAVDEYWELFSGTGCSRARTSIEAAAYIRQFVARRRDVWSIQP